MHMLDWSVRVERKGELVVSMEPGGLCGRDLSKDDEEAIRTAAHHLLAFIGDPQPSLREYDPGMNPADDAEFGMSP